MRTETAVSPLHVVTAVICGTAAVTAYAGAVGLIGGGLALGAALEDRLPFGSVLLAGLALLGFVAAPMSAAAIAALRPRRFTAATVLVAGELLLLWIAVELAFIQTYSWLQPVYLVVAAVVVALGWLLRPGSPTRRAWPRRAATLRVHKAPEDADLLGRL